VTYDVGYRLVECYGTDVVFVSAREFETALLNRKVLFNTFTMAEKTTASYDVILKVGDANFPCHRRILAEYSPYFEAMFGNNFIEKDKTTIEIQARRLTFAVYRVLYNAFLNYFSLE
jgi:hypothetical protein